jgi:hypothetical protein
MRRITKLVPALLVTFVLAAACSGGDTDSAGGDASTADEEAAQSEAEAPEDSADAEEPAAEDADDGALDVTSAAGVVDPSPRHVIYNIDLTVETEDVARAAARAAALAETAGGFVSHESAQEDSATITLRVPSSRHAQVVSDLEELGDVVDRSRNAEDVTSEVVDVEARVESQRRSVGRIRELLDDATDLADVVRIESELASREANLDSLLQRQEQLSSLTTLATVTVTFYRNDEAPADDETTLSFLSGLGNGWDAFVGAARVAAAVVGALLPFAVTAGVIGIPIWMLVRRSRRDHLVTPAVETAGMGESGGDR